MKYATLALVGIGLIADPTIAAGQAPKAAPDPKPTMTLEQKIAYSVGLNIGKSMKQQGIDMDVDIVAKGIKDALADKPALTDAQVREVMTTFQQQMMAKQQEMAAKQAATAGAEGDKNLNAGRAFLADNKAKPGVTTLPSGLQYKVLKEGKGKSPKLTDSVVANYRGTLIDGTEFDSSYKRGEPAEFPVNGVIKGWTEILQKMKVGDKYQVFIPAELAYGAQPRGAIITPNSALVFEIDLIDVK